MDYCMLLGFTILTIFLAFYPCGVCTAMLTLACNIECALFGQ